MDCSNHPRTYVVTGSGKNYNADNCAVVNSFVALTVLKLSSNLLAYAATVGAMCKKRKSPELRGLKQLP